MVKRKKQSIHDWKDRQDEHMKKLSLDMNGLQDALQSELINTIEVDRYICCISSKFDLVRQDSEKIMELLANGDERKAEFQRIEWDLREEVAQLRRKAQRVVDEVKRKEEEETKRYFEMLKNQSAISKKTEMNGMSAKVNDAFKNSKIEVLEEKVMPEESCDNLQVEKLDKSKDDRYHQIDEIPCGLVDSETINISCTVHETNVKIDTEISIDYSYWNLENIEEKIHENQRPESVTPRTDDVYEEYPVEIFQSTATDVEDVCSLKGNSCDQINNEQQNDILKILSNGICEKYEIGQSTVKQIVDIDHGIVDRFSCTCDDCMFLNYDSSGDMELEKDCPDWTETWLELCKSNIGDPWNISYDKTPDAKSIEKIASKSKSENCEEIKRSRQNVKISIKSQERNRKTKRSKGLKRSETEAGCKMPYETMKTNSKVKRQGLKHMVCKKVYDSVMSTKKVRSKIKRNKHRCNYTSDSKKETYKKLRKSVFENRRKVKISLHKTKLLQFKYRRKKMAKIRYMSISGNFHVTSLLIKQYRSKNMTRSVKKVKFKGTKKYQCSKRCRKITLIKYWLKKPWKEKIVDKIKYQAQYSC